MKTTKTPLGLLLGLAATLLIFSSEAAAQVAGAASAPRAPSGAADTAGLTREQVNPAAQASGQKRQRPMDVFSNPPKEVCPLSDDPKLAFDFKQGVVEDEAKVLSDQDKQSVWGDRIGHRLTPRDLCEMRDQLAARIFRKGILARVIIPPQTIADGAVRFQVIAAKIVAVRYAGEDLGPVQARVETLLGHLRRQNVFDLDVVQKWLLLVNDIPGVQATATMIHSQSPGAPPEGLDLVVVLKRNSVDVLGQVSNYNSKTLGPWSGITRVDFNSFTSLGERTSIVLSSTIGNNRQQVVQLLEAAKIGDSGLFGQASFSYGHARPGNALTPLDLTGNSYVGSFELDYPLIRLQRETLIAAAGMDLINQDTHLPANGTVQSLADDSLRVVWLRLDSSFAAMDRPWGGMLVSTQADLSVQARKGLQALGASVVADPGLSRAGGRADAFVIRADGHASITFTPLDSRFPPMALSTHLIGQAADRPLLAFEEQGIGDLSIGRGYDPSVVSGDQVIADELKAQVGPIRIGQRLKLYPYVLGDIARVTYLTSAPNDVTLHSIGAGVELRWTYDGRGDQIRLDAGYADPLDRPFASSVKLPPQRFLVQLSITH